MELLPTVHAKLLPPCVVVCCCFNFVAFSADAALTAAVAAALAAAVAAALAAAVAAAVAAAYPSTCITGLLPDSQGFFAAVV